MNLGVGIANIIGPRAFLNFITGRYHAPIEENRFVVGIDDRDGARETMAAKRQAYDRGGG
jgi:hypothetical protein